MLNGTAEAWRRNMPNVQDGTTATAIGLILSGLTELLLHEMHSKAAVMNEHWRTFCATPAHVTVIVQQAINRRLRTPQLISQPNGHVHVSIDVEDANLIVAAFIGRCRPFA